MRKEKPKGRAAKPYRFLDHPADVGFIVRGKDLPALFVNAALALSDYGWELKNVKATDEIHLRVRAASLEDLLFSWLSDILFLTDAEAWVFKRFTVKRVAQSRTGRKAGQPAGLWEIIAVARGEKFVEGRHQARTYIKAVTYHQLEVKKTARGWQARVYIDV